jgi:hypothetical protein
MRRAAKTSAISYPDRISCFTLEPASDPVISQDVFILKSRNAKQIKCAGSRGLLITSSTHAVPTFLCNIVLHVPCIFPIFRCEKLVTALCIAGKGLSDFWIPSPLLLYTPFFWSLDELTRELVYLELKSSLTGTESLACPIIIPDFSCTRRTVEAQLAANCGPRPLRTRNQTLARQM